MVRIGPLASCAGRMGRVLPSWSVMGRVSTSIELFKSSWSVLRQDGELLVLPVLSALSSLLMIGLFAYPLWLSVSVQGDLTNASFQTTPVTYVLAALIYFVLAFVTIFFNSALVHAANQRMSGGDPTLGSALGGATSRLGRILPWALVSATVSHLIRTLQQRAGFLGGLLGFLGGLAWAAVTFLVLPILVLENVGPIDAVKRSAGLLRKAWGEGLAGHVGLGLVGFLAMLPFIAIGVLGAIVGSVAVTALALVLAVVGIVMVMIVMSALSVVYQTALYRFATNQVVPSFESSLMQQAFRPR